MITEKHGNDLLGFRVLAKPEVASRECSVGSKSDFGKAVFFSLEGSNLKSLKPPPFVVAIDATTSPESLKFEGFEL